MTGSNSENWIPLWEEWEDAAAMFHVRFFRRQVLGSALCSTVGRLRSAALGGVCSVVMLRIPHVLSITV